MVAAANGRKPWGECDMAKSLHVDICPETGIGCVLIGEDAQAVKIDLMPDEVANLRELVSSGKLVEAKALLTSIEAGADAAFDGPALEALAREVR